MKQNIYDDPVFFAGYQNLRASESGLNACLEQPALYSLLPPLENATVLDLGCGTGGFCRHAVEHGAAAVTGVDISTRMLRAAMEAAASGISYCNHSLEDFAYQGPPLDLVTSSLALHYVEDFAAVVQKTHGWLKPGGRFIFSVEHPICTASMPEWHCHPDGSKAFWPVDSYKDEGARSTRWFVDGVVKYHRTLETYVNTLIEAGFLIRRLLEPEAPPEFVAARPDLLEQRRRPPFLVIAAEKASPMQMPMDEAKHIRLE